MIRIFLYSSYTKINKKGLFIYSYSKSYTKINKKGLLNFETFKPVKYKPLKTKCKGGNLFMKVLNTWILTCCQHANGFQNKSPAPETSICSLLSNCKRLPRSNLRAKSRAQIYCKESLSKYQKWAVYANAKILLWKLNLTFKCFRRPLHLWNEYILYQSCKYVYKMFNGHKDGT